MIEADAVVDEIRRRARDGQPVRVFWVRVSTGRDDFATELRRRRGPRAIVSWVLRRPPHGRPLFVDPNSVMMDVRDVLDSARAEIEGLSEIVREHRGIDLVLISRSELSLADTSSPIVLPEWFPVEPGRTVAVRIDDLTWSTTVPLSNRVSALDDLRRILHEADVALVDRLQTSLRSDHRRIRSLWDRPGFGGDGGDVGEDLRRIARWLGEIRNPTGYRPSSSRRVRRSSAGCGRTPTGRRLTALRERRRRWWTRWMLRTRKKTMPPWPPF